MRRAFAVVVAAASIGFATPALLASPVGAVPARAAKTCSSGFKHAVIGGQQKCLRRGEYCAVAYKKQYRRYGYSCYGSPARLH